MQKYEDDVKTAAGADIPVEEFVRKMEDIIRMDAIHPSLSDKEVATDPGKEAEAKEPLSAEQALCKLKGTFYIKWKRELMARAGKMKAEALGVIKGLKQKVESTTQKVLSVVRDAQVDGRVAKIKATLAAFIILGTVAGEVHLLVAPLADMMGTEQVGWAQWLWLASASMVILAILSALAHGAFDEKLSNVIRGACGGCLCASGALIGYVRAAQCDVEGGIWWVYYALFTWVSIGAPAVTAWLLKGFFVQLRAYYESVKDRNFWVGLLEHHEECLVSEQAVVAEVDNMEAGHMDEFTEAYEELALRDLKRVELIRSTRREIQALLAKCTIRFQYWKPRISKDGWQWKALLALGLLGLLALMAASVRAEDGGTSPIYTLVLCDRSSSGAEVSCPQDRVMAVFEKWMEKASKGHGGWFILRSIGKGMDDVDLLLRVEAPRKFKAPLTASRMKWRRESRERMAAVSLPMKADASGIVEAMFVGSFDFAGVVGEKEAYVMSDFRYVGNGLNFEKRVPEHGEFLRWLKSLPSIPEYQGVRVVACGFHTASPKGSSKTTIASMVRLRQVWKETFSYWGLNDTAILEDCSAGE
jgi:hypothetical protein